MKKYKYIYFVEIGQKPKTKVYSCRSNSDGEELGRVQWYAPWRQYCFILSFKFALADEIVFSVGCLNDIEDFIGKL